MDFVLPLWSLLSQDINIVNNINNSERGEFMLKKRKTEEIDQDIKRVLERAPEFTGYTIKELAKIMDQPWPTTRWHLERLSSQGEVKYREVGRAKLYSLIKKSKETKAR